MGRTVRNGAAKAGRARAKPHEKITLEEYLKSVQHEDAAGEDVSSDDIDMIPDLEEEEEEVEHVGEDIFESRVSINMNPSLINIPNNFKDDKEDIVVDIVKQKTGASEVVFSKATVPIETVSYHKLMGPKSSGRVRGVGSGVTSTQLDAKHNCQSRIEPSDSSIVSLLLKEVQSLCQEVSQQRRSVGSKENIQPNSLEGVNKSCTTQIGNKHTSATNRMENSTIGMPQPHNFVNQVSPIIFCR
ncbi:hypothetical protein Cgig2_010922 [Carnegiea gigantea]|uniref:Uncharacterized protein n=1 Tax=Carnegiea gigantea TaxID=171969 RepID=A0A9Q1K327_9CARY|nr:hypothetical protein Cgig2_010922 [Carnegiea gigantea]